MASTDDLINALGSTATGVKNQLVNLFAPTDTSALPYASQLASAARQQKLADMLTQMGAQDIPVSTAGGITAPISPWAALAKGLQSGAGSYMGAKAEQNALNIANKGNENFSKSLANYYIDPGVAGSQLTPDSSMSLNLPSIPRPVFDKGANAFVPGAAETAPTDVALPGITTGSTPSHTRTLGERVAYDVANMQGGNPAQTAHFGTQYTTDAAKFQELQQLKPQVAAVMAQSGVPDTIKSALTAGLASEDPAAISATMKEWLSKGTAQAVNQATEISADASGVPANARRPGDKYYKMPDGTTKVVSGSDMPSPGKLQSDIDVAKTKAADRYIIQGGGPQTPITVDPTSKSLNGVTGLSQLAIDRLTGAPNQPRSAAVIRAVDKEISDYSINNNVNLSTMRSKATGIQNTLTNNVERNNQANILDQELSASIDTVTPYLNKIDLGGINKANVAAIWAGRQVNDGSAQVVADQLSRARDELAGYNAVAGGHMTVQGRPDPTPKNYSDAEKVLLDGITSGGATNLAKSISMSAAKNRAVLNRSVQDADYQLWDALGKGKEYKQNFGYDPEANPGVAAQTAGGAAAPGAGGGYASKDAAETALKAKGHKPGDSVQVTINGQTGTLVLH